MAIPSTLKVTELDFDDIKSNLKSFLSTKDEFKDFDFDASGMSFLLDVLAYNTHYNAIYANLLANEMFLDTAAKRSSVISHAKSLGYKPRGIQSARARIDLTIKTLSLVNASAPPTFIISKGTPFVSSVNNSKYQFVTNQDYSAPNNGDNTYTFNDIELVEGVMFSYEYLVETDDYTQRYTIPNPYVDESSIQMTIRNNVSDITSESWQSTSSILSLDQYSQVFFLQEKQNGYYEFYFGNGSIGKTPTVGNLITINYIASKGALANGAARFVPVGKISNAGNTSITAASYSVITQQSAVGGATAETIAEIKHNASNSFTVQNRAVTVDDYKNLIQQNFANIRSIRVWGGEDNIPVKYGKVIVCIQPQYGDAITQTEKDYIKSILSAKSVISIGLEFSDPEYINVMTSTVVYYNPNVIPKSMNIVNSVKSAIDLYSEENLEKFGAHFRFSKFVSDIDSVHEGINSNTTGTKIYKTVIPRLGIRQSYSINFYNKIRSAVGSVASTQFKILESDQWLTLYNSGTKLYASYIDTSGRRIIEADVGTVNFTKGIVELNSIMFTAVYGTEFRVIIDSELDDVESGLNNILRIRPEDVSIKTIAELPNKKRNL